MTAPVTRRALFAAAPALALFAAAPRARGQEATPAGAWRFTDDRGDTVELPARPEVIVAQVTAASALWDYGVRPVAIFGPQRRDDGSPDPMLGAIDTGAVASLGAAWGEFDLEALIALAPDLLVAPWYGEYRGEPEPLWYVPAEIDPTVEEVVPTLGILAQDVPITTTIDRFAELAAALGSDLASPDNAAAKERYDRAIADLEDAIAGNPGLRVLAMSPKADVFHVAHPAAAGDLTFLADLGLDIVAPDSDPEDFWQELTWEDADAYPADLILRDVRWQALPVAELEKIPTWATMPAVKAGQVTPWQLELPYSYAGYAPVLEDLAEAIRSARADIA